MLPVVNVIAVFTQPLWPLCVAGSRSLSLYSILSAWGSHSFATHTGLANTYSTELWMTNSLGSQTKVKGVVLSSYNCLKSSFVLPSYLHSIVPVNYCAKTKIALLSAIPDIYSTVYCIIWIPKTPQLCSGVSDGLGLRVGLFLLLSYVLKTPFNSFMCINNELCVIKFIFYRLYRFWNIILDLVVAYLVMFSLF